MVSIPVCMEFPGRHISIDAFLKLQDASFRRVFDAIIDGRGWLSHERAAEIVRLSPSQFSRVFSKRYGRPFREIQLILRMELSALVVTLTPWLMTQIAEAFHYSALGKWDHAFAKHFGVPPSSYRQRYLRNPACFVHGFKFLSGRAFLHNSACRSVKTA